MVIVPLLVELIPAEFTVTTGCEVAVPELGAMVSHGVVVVAVQVMLPDPVLAMVMVCALSGAFSVTPLVATKFSVSGCTERTGADAAVRVNVTFTVCVWVPDTNVIAPVLSPTLRLASPALNDSRILPGVVPVVWLAVIHED